VKSVIGDKKCAIQMGGHGKETKSMFDVHCMLTREIAINFFALLTSRIFGLCTKLKHTRRQLCLIKIVPKSYDQFFFLPGIQILSVFQKNMPI
jgi:hypothetical protein